ncbi:SGS domain-containing protein [Whalleya microplaca]|nr:SGS domain-containing protein [Whalleya microplaca]
MSSAGSLADQGVMDVKAGRYADGIAKLTEALKERPAPLWLLERSKAYLRTEKFSHALYDAEKALRVAFERANRDQIVEAQIRRAITFFRMGQFADADVCAYWALKILDGAKATEDDGQHKKVDGNGEYTATVSDVEKITGGSASKDGLAAAMNPGARSKGTSLRNEASSWRLQALTRLQGLPAGHPGRKVTISEKYPEPTAPKEATAVKDVEEIDVDNSDDDKVDGKGGRATGPSDEGSTCDTWEKVWEKYRALHAKNDIRTDYYQTNTAMNVEFFVKNVPKENFNVEAESQSVVLSPIPNTLTGSIHLFLAGRIKPSETKYTVKSMKVELVLQKETPGKWSTLQRANASLVDNIVLGNVPRAPYNQFLEFVQASGYKDPADLGLLDFNKDQTAWYRDLLGKLRAGLSQVAASKSVAKAAGDAPTKAIQTTLPTGPEDAADRPNIATKSTSPVSTTTTAKTTGAPAYPTSSKKGPMNWDTFAEGDDDDDAKEEGDVNSFFKKIYKDADDDTKRAMMKSYIESNGTSLSTSWTEASSKTYETMPPDGAEAKQWDK